MTYEHVLPQVFPVSLSVHASWAHRAVELLMWRDDVLGGSSFAVTSRARGGADYRMLWLSRVSAEFLAMSGLAPDELRDAVRAEIDRSRSEDRMRLLGG